MVLLAVSFQFGHCYWLVLLSYLQLSRNNKYVIFTKRKKCFCKLLRKQQQQQQQEQQQLFPSRLLLVVLLLLFITSTKFQQKQTKLQFFAMANLSSPSYASLIPSTRTTIYKAKAQAKAQATTLMMMMKIKNKQHQYHTQPSFSLLLRLSPTMTRSIRQELSPNHYLSFPLSTESRHNKNNRASRLLYFSSTPSNFVGCKLVGLSRRQVTVQVPVDRFSLSLLPPQLKLLQRWRMKMIPNSLTRFIAIFGTRPYNDNCHSIRSSTLYRYNPTRYYSMTPTNHDDNNITNNPKIESIDTTTNNTIRTRTTRNEPMKSIRKISFVTDIEGDREYLTRYVTISKVLYFRNITDIDRTILVQNGLYFPYTNCIDFVQNMEKNQQQQQQQQHDEQKTISTTPTIPNNSDDNNDNTDNNNNNDMFVFGGDAWDQGGSDLWVIRQLLFLQSRFPNNVYLIIGNRDGNKMRILHELGASTTSTSPSMNTTHFDNSNNNNSKETDNVQENDKQVLLLPKHYGAYWLKGTGYLGDPNHGPFPINQTAVERLQWMLSYTMGSPRAFQYRKWELQQEQMMLLEQQQQQQKDYGYVHNNTNTATATATATTTTTTISSTSTMTRKEVITDDDVVESYRTSCHPRTGEMGMYLSKAHLMVRLGEIVFVHGGLPITPKIIEQYENNTYRSDFWDDMTFAMPWLQQRQQHQTRDHQQVELDSSSGTTGMKCNNLNFDAWLIELNKFVTDCVESWRYEFHDDFISERIRKRNMWSWTGGYNETNVPKFAQLIQYGMGSLPNREPNPTVVYNGWRHLLSINETSFKNHQEEVEDVFVQQTRNFMDQTGVRLICCGHQPQGDMPNAIRLRLSSPNVNSSSSNSNRTDSAGRSNNGFQRYGWIVSADTSYSGDTMWVNHIDDEKQRSNVGRGLIKSGRGPVAVGEVIIEQCTTTGKVLDVYFHGILSDGTKYETHSLDFENIDISNQNTEMRPYRLSPATSAIAMEDVRLVTGTIAQGWHVPTSSSSSSTDISPETVGSKTWWTRAAFKHPKNMVLLVARDGFNVWNRMTRL